MEYSKIIKNYREKHFLSQADFAKLLGVSYVSVNRWENKHFEPTIKAKKKINELINKK
jgi:DNA-binding transcriptional regulator YiaG